MSINTSFVDDFCSFLEVPEKHKSVKGNIDKAEIMETLSAHGMALVTSRKLKIAPKRLRLYKITLTPLSRATEPLNTSQRHCRTV